MTFSEQLWKLVDDKNALAGRHLKRTELSPFIDALFESEHKARTRTRKKAEIAEGAEQVYALYPKKVGHDDALVSITKALKNHPLEYLLDKTNQFRVAVEAWPSSYRYFMDGGDRCPHPATWFNQGRFQDDPKEWRRAGARSAAPASHAQTQAKAPTPEEVADHAAYIKQLAEGPEPEKGTLEHSLWVEARRNSAISTVENAATQVTKAVEQEQRLRKA